jgi:hypothetical protein
MPGRGFAGLGDDNTLAAGGLTEADCEGNGMVIDTVTGFCVLTGYATPQELQLAAAAPGPSGSINVTQYAPPVYVSNFQTQPNNGNLPPQYYVDQTAASVAEEVNNENQNLYDNFQIAVQNWVQGGSQGAPPSPPSYQTFSSAWAPNNMGGTPASISTAAPGTPLAPGTVLTGGSPAAGTLSVVNAPSIPTQALQPVAPAAAPAPVISTLAPGVVTQAQLQAATNSPPVDVTGNAPGAAAPASAASSGSSAPGALASITAWLEGESFGVIPNWLLVAAGGAALLYLFAKKGR